MNGLVKVCMSGWIRWGISRGAVDCRYGSKKNGEIVRGKSCWIVGCVGGNPG